MKRPEARSKRAKEDQSSVGKVRGEVLWRFFYWCECDCGKESSREMRLDENCGGLLLCLRKEGRKEDDNNKSVRGLGFVEREERVTKGRAEGRLRVYLGDATQPSNVTYVKGWCNSDFVTYCRANGSWPDNTESDIESMLYTYWSRTKFLPFVTLYRTYVWGDMTTDLNSFSWTFFYPPTNTSASSLCQDNKWGLLSKRKRRGRESKNWQQGQKRETKEMLFVLL